MIAEIISFQAVMVIYADCFTHLMPDKPTVQIGGNRKIVKWLLSDASFFI